MLVDTPRTNRESFGSSRLAFSLVFLTLSMVEIAVLILSLEVGDTAAINSFFQDEIDDLAWFEVSTSFCLVNADQTCPKTGKQIMSPRICVIDNLRQRLPLSDMHDWRYKDIHGIEIPLLGIADMPRIWRRVQHRMLPGQVGSWSQFE